MPKVFWAAILLSAGVWGANCLWGAFESYSQIRRPPQSRSWPIDLHSRWVEVQYVLRGRNPYDVAFAHVSRFHDIEPRGQQTASRNSDVFSDLGPPGGIDYPPWSFPTLTIFLWPGATDCRWYYALWLAAGLAFVAAWTARQMRDVATRSALLTAAVVISVLACSAWGKSITVGNNPLIVVGFLMLAFELLVRNKNILAGLAMGAALLKPTVAGPFLIPLLLAGRWTALASAFGFISCESLLTWVLTKTNPIEMLRQMMSAGNLFIGSGFGPVQYLIHAGVFPSHAAALAAAGVLLMAAPGFWALRRMSLLAQFSFAAIVARFWAYHLDYDNAVLSFALVYLAIQLEQNRTSENLALFLFMAITLWMSGWEGELDYRIQILDILTWLAVGVSIVKVAVNPGPGAEQRMASDKLAVPNLG